MTDQPSAEAVWKAEEIISKYFNNYNLKYLNSADSSLRDAIAIALTEQAREIERLKVLWNVIEDMPETGGYPTLAQWESVIDAHEAARRAAQGGPG